MIFFKKMTIDKGHIWNDYIQIKSNFKYLQEMFFLYFPHWLLSWKIIIFDNCVDGKEWGEKIIDINRFKIIFDNNRYSSIESVIFCQKYSTYTNRFWKNFFSKFRISIRRQSKNCEPILEFTLQTFRFVLWRWWLHCVCACIWWCEP